MQIINNALNKSAYNADHFELRIFEKCIFQSFENRKLFYRTLFCICGVFCIISCYFWCVYRIRCHFLYIWKYFKERFLHFWKCPEVWTIIVRNVFVFPNCIYTVTFGRKYYWYGRRKYYWFRRREILRVWSAVIITGKVGGNYYWYFRAEIL